MEAELGRKVVRVGCVAGLCVVGGGRGAGDLSRGDETRGASVEKRDLEQGGELYAALIHAEDAAVDTFSPGDLGGCRSVVRHGEVARGVPAEGGARKLLDFQSSLPASGVEARRRQ